MPKVKDTPLKSKMRKKFNEKLSSKEGYYNSVLLTREKYNSIIEEVKRIKALKTLVSPPDYRLIAKYDILPIGGREKLIKPKSPNEKFPKVYIHADELFDVLYATHTSIGHVKQDKMLEEIRTHYKNITKAHLKMFTDMCESCRSGSRKAPKKSKFNNKCQVCFCSFEKHPDGDYRYVLVYQEYSTQFVILKPLVSLSAKEVTDNLLDIFLFIGPPSSMNMHSQKDLFNGVLDSLRPIWSELKMTYGYLKQSGCFGPPDPTIDREIEEDVTSWMSENNTNKWAKGLRIIQYTKNTTYHPEVEKTPFEAVFSNRVTMSMNASYLEQEGDELPAGKQKDKVLKIKVEPFERRKSSLGEGSSDDMD